MKNDGIPCCAADALRRIRQVKINGVMTGITMLDESIAAVRAEGPASDTAIREALTKRVKVYNYIPPAVEDKYAEALMEEYRKQTERKQTT
ncbi:MAG: hypothetical protein A4E34_02247 [Methanoregula sp. PtaU1.Bin006]|uniref:hypothetical protein n=1 Tax=Methanoregula sp. PtaU1.Bin006 TaxID=1811681 RepID=UPI0009C89093|nr:hypothetical protein [Methanoregula sp. PtaU1.Bin006]OPY32870.1 MAG: hypothetical protein A4E34_02247 [Methanoregula sp. PtaU1.Bin006]